MTKREIQEPLRLNGFIYSINVVDLAGQDAYIVTKRQAGMGRFKPSRLGVFDTENESLWAVIKDANNAE
jgi:hypothetical protein